MNVTITPTQLKGTITPPPSKSQAHRLIIANELAEGGGSIANLALSQDIEATRRCMAALRTPGEELPLLDCGESGSTLRFLIPVALVLRGGGRFTGRGRLMERPQKPYFDLFDEKGIFYEQGDGVLTVRGTLTPGEYRLPGNISSQFFTGLLYALPLVAGTSRIVPTTALESWSSLAMTLEALDSAGVAVTGPGGEDGFSVTGPQTYTAGDWTVEADWSQAGFWYAATGIGNAVSVAGMNLNSAQGDRIIGTWKSGLEQSGDVTLDVSDCPDLVPPLAAWAALREGTTSLINAARLRIKESDRLAAVAEVLTALGANVTEGADSLIIRGKDGLRGGVTVSGHNDHRIAMMAAVAATRCAAPVTITGAECVAKSYPAFWEDYEKLGGMIRREEKL